MQAPKMTKIAVFALLESSKLISRKIRVIQKSWNFHTVLGSCETSSNTEEKDFAFDNYEECLEKCLESEDEDLIPYNITSNHYKCYPLLDQEIGHSVANLQHYAPKNFKMWS